ncbi:cytochrome c-type biogenesis protein, partial [Brevundimonas sp.]|uniref:cytochrome c-type biogenesis protein n=1 Tax=Brevundimonas sp. TaxID=1871086 RepID=UPI00289C6A56
EARARALFTDIRCVVCQHEAIADSPAAIAADMRRLVREQIAAGRSDQDIREDLVRRYGEYVLFTPPFRGATLVLWLGPFALAAGTGLVLWLRARRRSDEASLSAQEEAELERFIGSATEKSPE